MRLLIVAFRLTIRIHSGHFAKTGHVLIRIIGRDFSITRLVPGMHGFIAFSLAFHQIDSRFLFLIILKLGHTLVRTNQLLFKPLKREMLPGNLTQRNHGILVFITRYMKACARTDFARALGRQHNQFKAIWQLFNTIFNSNSGHISH